MVDPDSPINSSPSETESNTPLEFNPYASTLEPGLNLIEASAGTGKTFSIVMLVLRFLLEKGFTLDQLLVVTFTNAAAQELRDRIRFRLVEVKSILSGKDSTDSNLNQWVSSLGDAQQSRARIIDALADIDNANIFTIHGFCQRTLSQYALESGQVFGSELLENISQIKQQVAEDYWRIQTYSRSRDQVALLRNIAATPDKLLLDINAIREGSRILPENIDLEDCLAALDTQLGRVKVQLSDTLTNIQTAIQKQADSFKPAFVTTFEHIQNNLLLWVADEISLPLADILSLSTDKFEKDALNGNKFRKLKDKTSEQRKEEFFQEYEINFSAIDELELMLTDLGISFHQGLYQYLQAELEARLTKTNQLSFDGIIKRLSQALEGEHASHLKHLLQDKYPIALIDEFQDTDNAQWSIFSTLAECPTNFLYLIGDPKQAIYKFRGADIHSYLGVKLHARREYNLAINWRSKAPLVEAINTLFNVDDPFLNEHIAYHPVRAAKLSDISTKKDQTKNLLEQSNGRPCEQLVLWELDKNPDQKDGYWLTNKGKPKEQVRSHVVSEILSLLDGNHKITLGDQPVSPNDIAILVRTNPEASVYQQALSDHGIPAVLNSKTSVFTSEQAFEIYHLLHAISRPGNLQLLRYALCQSWFGYSGNDLYALFEQPQQLDDWLIIFQRYHDLWERKGLLAMMHLLMEDQNVAEHLSKLPRVERSLTNINHILELIQEAAINQRLSMSKTLEWLEDALQEKVIPGGQELRLESDENAIEIVTIHGSKGLEYPIVFCPDLWAKSGGNLKEKVVVFHQDDQQLSDLGSKDIDAHRNLADIENRAEELRLLYVALTRAKYRCYIAWADQRSAKIENNSALAYLLKKQTGDSWSERMASLREKNNQKDFPMFDYQLLEVDKRVTDYYQAPDKVAASEETMSYRQPRPSISADWIMSSYSGLANYSIHEGDMHELPLDKSEENEKTNRSGSLELQEKSELPKGAHTGNLVHELLEYTSFKTLSEELDNSDYIDNRTEMIRRFAVDIKDTDTLDELLRNTVTTPLSPDDNQFILADLTEKQCLKEMPFYFSVEQLDTKKINTVLMSIDSYLPLSRQQMRGQLTGFIDLICEYQGRYYVMDYKTNSLDDYSEASMTEAMREHNYGLQYWIYTLVLHRHLQSTLPNYDFDHHFGGVRYLFVRGMHPDQPMSGVFQDQPDIATLEALSRAFNS